MKMYLKEDFSGFYSEIEYGKKADEVTVISESGNMALVDNGKELFHIRLEKLSDKPIESETSLLPPPAMKTINKSVKKKRINKQSNLFK